MDMLASALYYASLNLTVFPLNGKIPITKNGLKDATQSRVTITNWWLENPDANIGIALGADMVVFDIDGDIEEFNELLKGDLQTPTALTGSGGYHIYFKTIEPKKNATKVNGTQIDIRGLGGYVVAPPSIHPETKEPYKWLLSFEDVDIADLPPELEDFLKKTKSKKIAVNLSLPTVTEGGRNNELTVLAGKLRAAGLTEQELIVVLHSQNKLRCNPPLPDNEIETIAKSISNYPPYPNTTDTSAADTTLVDQSLLYVERTNTGYAEGINLLFGSDLRFNHTNGKWYVWYGNCWQLDTKETVIQYAIKTTREIQKLSKTIEDETTRNQLSRFASSCQSMPNIQAGVKILKSLPNIGTTHTEWNTDPFLLGVNNGVIDLRTGNLREGLRGELISQKASIDFNPHAKAPVWEKFVNDIFNNDAELISFVQRAAGYTLTGDITEQVLFLLIGNGANGKSLFVNTLKKILGQYATVTPFATFEKLNASGNREQTNDLAALDGARLVVATETARGKVLDDARIKGLTGGDEIAARYLRQEFFQFKPVCKIWLTANHAPKIQDDSDGIWRRLRRIDFTQQFLGPKADPNLDKKLQSEFAGILNWCLEGLQQWLVNGLGTPITVSASIERYREGNDIFVMFWRAWIKEGGNEFLPLNDLIEHLYKYGAAMNSRFIQNMSYLTAKNYVIQNHPNIEIVDGIEGYRNMQLVTDLTKMPQIPQPPKTPNEKPIKLNIRRV